MIKYYILVIINYLRRSENLHPNINNKEPILSLYFIGWQKGSGFSTKSND